MATREEKYTEQLKTLGIYEDAYAPAIHELCIMEREMSRARKQLKDKAPDSAAPSYADPLYGVIRQLQNNILAYRDALGLTPKSMRRLKGQQISIGPADDASNTLAMIMSKHG